MFTTKTSERIAFHRYRIKHYAAKNANQYHRMIPSAKQIACYFKKMKRFVLMFISMFHFQFQFQFQVHFRHIENSITKHNSDDWCFCCLFICFRFFLKQKRDFIFRFDECKTSLCKCRKNSRRTSFWRWTRKTIALLMFSVFVFIFRLILLFWSFCSSARERCRHKSAFQIRNSPQNNAKDICVANAMQIHDVLFLFRQNTRETFKRQQQQCV